MCISIACVFVCVCVCVFIKLHITTQSGPVIVCVCVCVVVHDPSRVPGGRPISTAAPGVRRLGPRGAPALPALVYASLLLSAERSRVAFQQGTFI